MIHLDGLVSIKLEAQNHIQRVQIVNTFDAVPDVPITSFELKIDGGKNGVLKNFTSLCAKELVGEATFTAHSGKVFSDKPVVDVPGCESASAGPRASIKLRGVRSGEPVLTVRVRRAAGGAKLNGLRIALPTALRGNRRMAAKGVTVRSAGKAGPRRFKLTRSALVVKKLPKKGVTSIRVVVGDGALQAAAGLRATPRAPRLKFRLRVTDAAKRIFRITLKVRARP